MKKQPFKHDPSLSFMCATVFGVPVLRFEPEPPEQDRPLAVPGMASWHRSSSKSCRNWSEVTRTPEMACCLSFKTPKVGLRSLNCLRGFEISSRTQPRLNHFLP